jgi:hypothetical protein
MRAVKVCERFVYEPGSDQFEEVSVRPAAMGVRDDSGYMLFRATSSSDAD